MNLIDVSHWQGSINWLAVKSDDIEGAIIKAGGSDDGFYTDSKFEDNYIGAKSVGLSVGAYYFVGPDCKSTEDGIADAKRFIDILSGKQFDLPVYIDFECPDASNKKGNTDSVIGFCETMEDAGYFVGVYASDISGFQDRLELERLTPYTLWVARYGSEPVNATNWDIWQYSSQGSVSGINGNVDLNNCRRTDFINTIINGGFNGYNETNNTETKSQTNTIEIGMPVTIRPGAIDLNTGYQFADFVYETNYIVLEVQDRGVVFGTELGGTPTGVVSYNDIFYKEV